MLESIWMKSNCGERDSASAIARCGASKIEISWTPPIPMPVCFLNSAMTGCMGTRYGDQIIPLTSTAPAVLAAATVRSSMVAASASGDVPGTKFASVRPTPPSITVRREIFDLVMATSPPSRFAHQAPLYSERKELGAHLSSAASLQPELFGAL